jgi:AcrR family transcriptional regulator
MAQQDRRIRRTRAALSDAFLSLVVEKGYEQITVQDILDRADVGRSTFYAHYRDKEALLLACFDDVQKQLRVEVDTPSRAGDSIEVARPAALVFEHAYRNQRVYRVLCGKQGGDAVQRYLHGLIGDPIFKTISAQSSSRATDLHAEVVAEFYTAAALGLLTWWIDHDFCRGPSWLATTYLELAVRGHNITPL